MTFERPTTAVHVVWYVVDEVTKKWRRHLQAFVHGMECHFEHLLQ